MAPPSDQPPKGSQDAPTTTTVNTASSNNNEQSSAIWTKDYWLGLFEGQRLERLKQCHALGRILEQCKAMQKDKNMEQKIPKLDQASVGIRMLKYYDWRYRLETNQKGCVPEKHAVWSCRAVSLGCGAHLAKLRTCFDQEGMDTVLRQPRTAYEGIKKKKKDGSSNNNKPTTTNIPCAELQQALGACVAEKAKILEQNQSRRNKQ